MHINKIKVKNIWIKHFISYIVLMYVLQVMLEERNEHTYQKKIGTNQFIPVSYIFRSSTAIFREKN
jgi:hypothetical protein